MGDVKISALPPQASPTTADQVPIVQSGVTYYETLANIISLFFQNYPSTDVSVTGWQTQRSGAAFPTPNSITYNGNRSYDVVFNSVDLTGQISNGMRLRATRTTAGPTQCTSLNGSTHYYSKTSPAGTTFTDDFVVGGWIKPTTRTGNQIIASRYNGTSGWQFYTSSGQVVLVGFNAGSGNFSAVTSQQCVPMNRWSHVAAQLDMSAFTATPTTSYVMMDGIDVPTVVSRGGTNPTALVQAGNLEIGSSNGGTNLFNGKLAQIFYSSAKITQANVRTLPSQSITSALITANAIVSAYSFNNSIADLNTTSANDLTANGGAAATNADSFCSQQGDGTISTKDYAIVMKAAFSTNTTLTVQVPEGNTLPTSGLITSMAYSMLGAPYQFPAHRQKWIIQALSIGNITTSFGGTAVWYVSVFSLNVPLGKWLLGFKGPWQLNSTVAGVRDGAISLASSQPTAATRALPLTAGMYTAGTTDHIQTVNVREDVDLSAATSYALYGYLASSTGAETWEIRGDFGMFQIFAENPYL